MHSQHLLTIGITDCKRFENYQKWFEAEKGVKVIRLSPEGNNLADIEKCNGVVLSGGEDVHPKYYGHPEWMDKKDELKLDVNETRDEFEMRVIDIAFKKKIPLLGICRGLQIANVYFKGTLIPDMNKVKLKEHSKDSGVDKAHQIIVEPNTCLSAVTPPSGGWGASVNSAHHQAADKVGEGLKVSARSSDGTIEALELKESKDQFLLLVQWHPERMENQQSPLAASLKERFLAEIRKR